MAVEKKASNDSSAEMGVAGGRGNADFTAFVSNLPFNITVDELREKFKHVSFCHLFCVSLLPLLCVIVTPSVCHYHPFCMSLLPLLYVIVTPSVCHCYPFCVSLLPLLCVIVTLLYIGCHWLQCGDIADIRLAHKYIRGRACKFGYVEFQSKVGNILLCPNISHMCL